MNINIQFGPVAIWLQDFLSSINLYRTWDWKLDSFLYHEEILNPDYWIDQVAMDINYSNLSIIKDEINGFFNKQIYKESENGYFFRLYRRAMNETILSYHVSPDWSHISLLEDHTNTDSRYAFEYLSCIMPYAMLTKSTLTFHGVLMEYNGHGLIFSANSGTGKTTHARLWRDHKHAFIVNGDKSACYKKDGVWTGFGMPWCGTSGEYMNREVPIKALVLIERGETNQVRKLNPIEGFKRLLEHAQYPSWDIELSSTALNLLNDFIERIPVYVLKCTIDTEAVDVLANELFQ